MNNVEPGEQQHREAAKSDEGIAFYNSMMPPYEIHLLDGTVLIVPYSELDEKLTELKGTYKERKKGR